MWLEKEPTLRKKTTKPAENLLNNVIGYGYETTALQVIRKYITTGETPADKKVMDALKFLQAGRSKTELEWKEIGEILIAERVGSRVVFTGYEWMSFRLPGGTYTPDIGYLFESGRWAFVEIKGSRVQKNYRDARSKLRAAACLNPWFVFYEARNERRSWQIEEIPTDTTLIDGLIQFGEDEREREEKNGNEQKRKSSSV